MHTTITTLYSRLGLTAELDSVRKIITDQVQGVFPFIEEALGDFISSHGKMLRPAMLILASRFSEERSSSHQLAAAIELLHMATLVHDDIIDRSSTRRGRESLNAKYGDHRAVLLGDYLFSRSFSLATRHTDISTGGYVSRIVGSICDSELRQDEGSFDFDIGFREYHRRIMGKTAALFAVSCYVGAVEAGLEERQAARLKKVGYNLGVSFQIIDDILDCSLSDGGMGKSAGNDIREGVVNLPILCALRRDDGSLRKLLERRPTSKRKISRGIRLIRDIGGVEHAKQMADRYLHKARRSISKLPEATARDQLDELARFLIKRSY